MLVDENSDTSRTATSTLRKRSVTIAGHSTSLTLEEAFWQALRTVAQQRNLSLNALVGTIDAERVGNLSSALRVFVLECYRNGELHPAAAPNDADQNDADQNHWHADR